MMELTRKGEYAIRGMLFLARLPAKASAQLGEIALATQAPATFLAKIMQDLAKGGLVSSARGSGGGFSLSRPAAEITLREVVETIEGPIRPNHCLAQGVACQTDTACRVHQVWRTVQEQVIATLEQVNLADLAGSKH